MRTYHDTDLPVLITGPTGSGKTTLARKIHALSARADAPFCQLNLAGLRNELMESELFGHAKGAFTGAHAERRGHLQEAGKGTLFLDEIGELDPEAQKKLLQVLDDGSYSPVGSCRRLAFSGRFILATHRDLRKLVAEGRFREDLYYRIMVFTIRLPSIAEDREALGSALDREWAGVCPQNGMPPGARERLLKHDWPGNYRELRNCLRFLAYHQELPEWVLGPGEQPRPS